GDTIEYSFTVTNTGNVTLTDITLTSLVPGVAVSGGPIASLAPGDSDSTTFTASYTLAQSDIDTGEFTGTFEVAGEWTSSSGQVTVATAQASDTQSIEEKPGIKLTKSGGVDPSVKNPFNIANPGDPIRYGITVENTGNVTLKGLRLTDPGAVFTVPYPPGVEVPPKDEDGQPTNGHLAKIDSLAPGAKITLNGYHTTLVEDFRRKSYTNTATVTGTPPSGQPVSAQSSHTEQLAPDPKIELRITTATQDLAKAGPADRVDAGDSITYTLTVKNIGNVPLTNVNLTSPVPGVVISGGPIASLEEDLSTTFTASYTLTQNDIDTGEFSGTFEVAGEWTSSSGDMMVATAQASDTQTLVADPKIALTTVGTLNTGSNNRVDAGDTISYAFTITNTGNVTLTDITLTDLVPGVAVSGGPIASLAPGDSDSTTFTASYTLTQADVDAGSFTNRVQVTGTPPNNAPNVTDEDEVTTPLAPVPVVGAAKQVVGSPVEVSTGVWDVTFEIRVRNYSNVTLSQLQVSEDLSAAFPIRKPDDAFAGNTPLPAVASFSVQSVTSTDFTPNASFNGTSDQNLLAGTDALAPGAEGTVQLVVRVTPITGGPFENSMTVRAATPGQKTVEDRSQNGSSPDPDNDGDPTNNNAPTPVNFGTLFQPPVGEKRVNTPDEDLLQWTLEWMNNANIQPLPVIVYDPIPQGTTYYARGLASSYPLPAGQLPSGSTTTGVSCTAASPATKTTACYYEGPTAEFPRGRVIWEGILAPDHLVETLEAAANKITIRFATRADKDAGQIHNTAVAGADLNVDGSIRGQDELQAAAAAADWVRPTKLPRTGFAPNMASHLPPQPAEKAYQQVGEMRLEIPALGVNVPVVGVPLTDGQWDVTWLGQNAGYLAGTSFPTWQGNAVITAHVYDANGLPGPFVNLKQLKWGDKILLHAFGSVYEYEVRTARRVQPDDLSIMETQKGTWVTLVTCESYDEASDSYRYRFAVQAVLMQVRQAGQ
ncbi:MAG: sortase, partial [Chloroflexi bacterium]|nr:sortase [Chloroflexota bacterium]